MEQKLCAWMVARRNKRVIVTKNMWWSLARKWDSASDTKIVWVKRVVYGDWQMFLLKEICTARTMFLRQTACHRGWSPLPSPLPSLLPKLANLVPNPQPRGQPNMLPRWQPSLQPCLQPESPFLWPLLSMCSPSESNTPARKSGTQSQALGKAKGGTLARRARAGHLL